MDESPGKRTCDSSQSRKEAKKFQPEGEGATFCEVPF